MVLFLLLFATMKGASMKQISKVSQLIRGLVMLVATLHLVTVGLTFFSSSFLGTKKIFRSNLHVNFLCTILLSIWSTTAFFFIMDLYCP